MEPFWTKLVLVTVIIIGLYKFLTKNNNFFKTREVKFVKPRVLFGNLLEVFTGRENGYSVFQKMYNKFKNEKIIGFFIFLHPVFIVKDADLMKQITIKDFYYFVNHNGGLTNAADKIFAKSLALLENHQWREMRNCL